jgi:hypothetical protein
MKKTIAAAAFLGMTALSAGAFTTSATTAAHAGKYKISGTGTCLASNFVNITVTTTTTTTGGRSVHLS